MPRRISQRRLPPVRRLRRICLEHLEDRSLLAGDAELGLDSSRKAAGVNVAPVIAGVVFHDLDQDGVFEPQLGEIPQVGQTLFLDLNGNGRFDGPAEPTSVSDATGRYAFTQLSPGIYRVGQAPSLDWVQTSPVQTPPTIRILNVSAEDIVYSPSRGKFFATFEDETRLVVIDPVAGTFETSVEVGSDLGQLALSNDERWLYVSVLDGLAVRRVDLTSGTVGPQFTLGSEGPFGPYRVDDMAVMPGNPDVVAISRRRRPGVSPPHGGVAIFENGVQRPVITPEHTGPNLIIFGDSPSTLYGIESYFSQNAFYRMSVDSTGVRVTEAVGNLVHSGRDIEFDHGRIYTSTGVVVDPEQLRLHGSFSRSGGGNVVAANSFQDVGYLATNNNLGGYRFEAFDQQSFLPLGRIDVSNLRSTPRQLERWGERGLALRTDDGRITLVEWDPRPATRLADVSGGLSVSNIDFGNQPIQEPGSITGQVFEDLDRSGQKSSGERGLAGQTIFIDDNGNGLLDSGERRAQTDVSGSYRFAGLAPGSYAIMQVVDTGWRQTSPALQEARVRRLDLAANDLVYDSGSGKILASIPSTEGLRGNSITVIDPVTAAIDSYYVGSEPGKLALSDDGQMLYVSLDGAGAVRQFDVDNQQAGLQFWLGQDWFGDAVFASDLAVMPGNSEVVVAALESRRDSSDPRAGIALFRQGIEQDAFDFLTAVAPIEFSNMGPLLFSATRLNQLARIAVTPTDLDFLEETATPVDFGSELEYGNGRLYTTTGHIYDATTGLRVGGYPASGAVEPDSRADITYFLSSGVIRAFNQQGGDLIRSWTIPGANSLHSSLIRWGEYGLAFTTFNHTWLVEWNPRTPTEARFHTVHVANGQVSSGRDFGNLALNAAPFAAPDQYNVQEDKNLIVANNGVLQNDRGDEGKSLTALLAEQPAHGALILTPQGGFTYTPAANFEGIDSFTYRVTDDSNFSNLTTVNITVTGVNDPPRGADRTIEMEYDVVYTLTINDFGFSDPNDLPGNALQAVKIKSIPQTGRLVNINVPVLNGQTIQAASIAAGHLRYIPPARTAGNALASFIFQVQDNGGTANGGIHLDPTPNTTTFEVSAVNEPPAGTDAEVTTLEDTPYVFKPADFGFHDPVDQPPNGFAAVWLATLPDHGVLLRGDQPLVVGDGVSLSDIEVGHLRFVPETNEYSQALTRFKFQVQDDGGTVAGGQDLDPTPNTLTISVTPVNDPPVARGDREIVFENGLVEVAAPGLLANDADADVDDTKHIIAVNGEPANVGVEIFLPSGAKLLVRDDGSYRYDPNGQFESLGAFVATFDMFVYEMSDGAAATSSAAVGILILGENDAPFARNDHYTLAEDTTLIVPSFGVLGNDADAESGFLAASPIELPTHGELVLNVDGSFEYRPDSNYHGTDSFTYLASDGQATSEATVTLNVTPVNDTPTVTLPSIFATTEGRPLEIAGSFTDPDAGDSWTATIDFGDGRGALPLVLAASMQFQLTHAYPDNGTFVITVRVRDAAGAVGVATQTIVLANAPPTNLTLTAPAVASRGQSIQLEGTFADPGPSDTFLGTIHWGDGTTTSFTASRQTTGLEFSASHAYAAAGGYEVIVQIVDDDGGSVVGSTGITVTGGSRTTLRAGVLELAGSSARDNIAVTLSGNRIVVNATYGATRSNLSFPRAGVQRIVANLATGDDALRIDSRLRVPLVVDAGAGNDRINAGGGPSVIVGGDGNDLLYGGGGRDILTGGPGRDQLWGFGGSDLLIAGGTTFDNNSAALAAILAEWTSSRSISARVSNLRTASGPLLSGSGIQLKPGETVLDDAEIDLLMGGTDSDWFLLEPKDQTRDRQSEPLN